MVVLLLFLPPDFVHRARPGVNGATTSAHSHICHSEERSDESLLSYACHSESALAVRACFAEALSAAEGEVEGNLLLRKPPGASSFSRSLRKGGDFFAE
jgi:hypothetical protein